MTKMRGRRDDNVRLRRLYVGKCCKRGVRRSPKNCKLILLLSLCPIWRWRRRMMMLDNKLYLVSVVWFLRRSRVDCGTGGSKVVVGSDSSKRKVLPWYPNSPSWVCPHQNHRHPSWIHWGIQACRYKPRRLDLLQNPPRLLWSSPGRHSSQRSPPIPPSC